MKKITYKKNIFEKIKSFFNTLYFKYVTNPKWKKEREIKNKKFKKDFEEKQKIAVNRIKEIMYHDKVYFENNTKLQYLNEKLVEGKVNVNKMSKFVSHIPAFYEPEICEIHNENLHLNTKSLNELIMEDDEISKLMIKKQTNGIPFGSISKNKK